VAGLEAGDVIVAVDGEPLGPGRDLAALLGEWAPGDEVTLGVMDGGELPGSMVQPREVTVTLGEHPDAQGRPYLGVRVTPAMPEMAPGGPAPGALVNLVADGGPADAAGLEQRDVILALDGKEILTPQELVDAIGDRQPGDEVVLTVRRPASRDADGQSQRLEVTVTLGEHPDDGQEGRAYLGVHLAPLMRPEAMPRPGPRSVQGAEEKDAGPADDGGLPLLRRLPWLRRVPGLRRLIPDLRGERGAPEGSTGPGLDRAGLGRSPVWSAP
jgi:hypothetical protein